MKLTSQLHEAHQPDLLGDLFDPDDLPVGFRASTPKRPAPRIRLLLANPGRMELECRF